MKREMQAGSDEAKRNINYGGDGGRVEATGWSRRRVSGRHLPRGAGRRETCRGLPLMEGGNGPGHVGKEEACGVNGMPGGPPADGWVAGGGRGRVHWANCRSTVGEGGIPTGFKSQRAGAFKKMKPGNGQSPKAERPRGRGGASADTEPRHGNGEQKHPQKKTMSNILIFSPKKSLRTGATKGNWVEQGQDKKADPQNSPNLPEKKTGNSWGPSQKGGRRTTRKKKHQRETVHRRYSRRPGRVSM